MNKHGNNTTGSAIYIVHGNNTSHIHVQIIQFNDHNNPVNIQKRGDSHCIPNLNQMAVQTARNI